MNKHFFSTFSNHKHISLHVNSIEPRLVTYNVFDNFRRAVKIDDTLVDSHLESIPSLGTLTTRSLPRGNSQHLRSNETHRLITTLMPRSGFLNITTRFISNSHLGRHTDGSLHLETLLFGSLDEIVANCKIKTKQPEL
jgi:hypothetical protein